MTNYQDIPCSDRFRSSQTIEDQYAEYLRKSRLDIEAEALGAGETLVRHHNMLTELAQKHEIMPHQITVYKEVVSGESIHDRPQMQKLLKDVASGKYKGVFVVEVERLARGNTKDQGLVEEAFQVSHTKIITLSKTYDTSNEFDEEYFEFGLFMSRREYKTIRRRMQAGLMESIKEGNYVGSRRPYGYDVVRVHKKERILVEIPDEARVVQIIFDWFTKDRQSTGWIARKLTELRIPTMTGNVEWNRATVKDILQNIHYAGFVRWNRRKCSKEPDDYHHTMVKKKRRLTPDEYQVFPGKHNAIISLEQFETAQQLFSLHAPIHKASDLRNPLAGLLVCNSCGKTMLLQEFAKRPSTTPRFIHGESNLCTRKSSTYDSVMEAVAEGLKACVDDYEIKMSQECREDEMRQYKRMLDSLQGELDKQTKRRQRLFDAFEDGAYTHEEFIERKRLQTDTINELRKQMDELEQNTPSPVDYKEKIIRIGELLDTLSDPNVDAKAKNIFLKSIIDRIEYDVIDKGRNKGSIPVLDIYLK